MIRNLFFQKNLRTYELQNRDKLNFFKKIFVGTKFDFKTFLVHPTKSNFFKSNKKDFNDKDNFKDKKFIDLTKKILTLAVFLKTFRFFEIFIENFTLSYQLFKIYYRILCFLSHLILVKNDIISSAAIEKKTKVGFLLT